MRCRCKHSNLPPLSLFLVLTFIPAFIPAALAEPGDPAASAPNVTSSPQDHAVPPEQEGDLFMARRRYEAAIEAYKRESHRTAVLMNKIGVAYHHLFAFNEATKYYQQALAIDPRFSQALNNMGAIYYSQHNLAQAERTYRKAVKCEPGNAIAIRNLGLTYFADNKNKEGVEAYRKAVAMDPSVFHIDLPFTVDEGGTPQQIAASNYSMAKLCAAAGKMHEALSFLQKAHQAGFHDRKQLMKDNDLAALRSTQEFQQFMLEHTKDK